MRRCGLGVLCVGLLALALSAPAALGAVSDPLYVFIPRPAPASSPPTPAVPPPLGYLGGPCGVGTDSSGRFYVSDYYHDAVDVFSSPPNVTEPWKSYLGQLAGVDEVDGPCGLALAPGGGLYVNDFHRSVLKYNPFPSFGPGAEIGGAVLDGTHPTGVAVDSVSGQVYVDNRTYVAVYEPSGTPVLDGEGHPLRIGEGNLLDGYGVAVNGAKVYVPDAAAKRVKVYEPAVSLTTPTQTIAGPGSGFSSLRDTAIAVDRVSGKIYVVDNLQPQLTEKPEAQVDVFSAAGVYLGRLKYNIVDAEPPGLTVNNSAGGSQGQVYVTSGNTTQAGLYIYGPNAETPFGEPATFSLSVAAEGSGAGAVASSLAPAAECAGSCTEAVRAGAEATLTAIPRQGSAFAGWAGAGCSGTGTCTVTMDEAVAVGARFEQQPIAAQESPSILPPAAAGAAGKKHRPRRAKRHHGRHWRHHGRGARR